MTVRELVAEMQKEIGKGNLQPDRSCELLARLTALLGNCAEEIREADHAYNVVLLACLAADEAANRARIRSEVTPEYRRRREAKDTRELVIEMVRSLKYILRMNEETMRLGG